MLVMAQRGLAKPTPPTPAPPNAVADVRNIAAHETMVSVPVLDNDENAEGATLSVPSFSGGILTPVVAGSNIEVTRSGTGSGSYTLTYVATVEGLTPSSATLSGAIAAVSGTMVGPIEPVDTNIPISDRIDINVNITPRQTWHGFGWGTGASNLFTGITSNITKLCEDVNATVVRFFTPENTSTFLSRDLPWWNLIKNRGIDTIFTTSFIHTAAAQVGVPNASGMANGIHACINGGIPINYVTMQNEPDGGQVTATGFKNSIPPGFSSGQIQVNSSNADAVAGYYTTVRNTLNNLQRQSVKLLSHEWRHPTTQMPTEFDIMDARGLYSNVISGGCLHIYDKGPDNNVYDSRYLTKGQHLWSTETGNNGSPNCQARFLAGVNHGTVVELIHYAMVRVLETDSARRAETLGQALLDYDGTKRPWYGAVQVISTNLIRGTVIRRCQSSDRPSGLNATHADRMIRQPGASGGRNPRQQVIAGRRSTGHWTVAAVNTTHETDAFNTFTSGHYGAAAQQLTVTIPELSGLDREFSAKRADINGSVSGPTTVNLKNGVMRFKLAPGETIGMTSNV